MKSRILSQIGSLVYLPLLPVRRIVQGLAEVQQRERQRLTHEMVQTRGLMPLLMKQRNGQRWSEEDRKILREDVAALIHMSPYLLLFVAPGGFFVMPLLAWWLDRRRSRRSDPAGASPAG